MRQDKAPPRRVSNAWLPQLLRHVSEHVREIPAPLLLWTLFSSAATVCLLNTLCSRRHRHHPPHQNQNADKQRADKTHSEKIEENKKKHEEENDSGIKQDSEVDDGLNEEDQEDEQEEEVSSEEKEEDSVRKRKWGFLSLFNNSSG